VTVQRAHHDPFVGQPVGQWSAAVRTHRVHGPQRPVAQPEHRDLTTVDREGAALADGDVVE
jgi:hypothetical protein